MDHLDRHRVLDAIVRRLSRHVEGERWLVRGGMHMRGALPGLGRVVRDLDLVAREPFDQAAVRETFAEVLAWPMDDGVAFDARVASEPRFRVGRQDHWLAVRGFIEDRSVIVGIDLAYGVPFGRPQPMGPTSRLHRADPASVVARKIELLRAFGPAWWRPKDLYDVHRWLTVAPPQCLGEALEARLGTVTRVREALALGPHANRPWRRFVEASAPSALPDVTWVLEEVRHELAPFLGSAS